MTLVTFSEAVTLNFQKSAMTTQLIFEAGREYVLGQQHITQLIQQQGIAARVFKNSRIDNRITNFHVEARRPGSQKLLLYNGSGGYGDQIMTWPLARILQSRGYSVHVLVDPGNQMCWWNFPWIASIMTFPVPYELFKMFDYHIMFETLVNVDEHQDQLHPLDVMLNKIGINPTSVDPALKVVRPNFTFLEMQSGQAAFGGKPVALYQLSAANTVRSLPPSDSAYLLCKLADSSEVLWLAIYDQFNLEAYRTALICPKCQGHGHMPVLTATGTLLTVTGTGNAETKEVCGKCNGSGTLRKNIQLYNAPNLRELWALAMRAKVIVAPDSMMIHVAGCMELPCVGLWGLASPGNRTRYYKNHLPIWKREACPFSPCFGYSATFPRYCPPRPNRVVCECLAAISPEDLITAVRHFIPCQQS
jgi:hypothetical protein